MKLSILDQVHITAGGNAEQSLQNTKELARLGDSLGYERIRFAEHHGSHLMASAAPEIIAAFIAAATDRIRVGTGGVMMMHYSPLKIAEVFKTLSGFAPGRIDLGVGRAPGGDRQSMYALAQGNPPQLENHYEKLRTILDLLEDRKPQDPLYRDTPAAPVDVTVPQTWLLGSSGNSAVQAGRMGVGYSFAQFFTGTLDKSIFDLYKKNFAPSAAMPEKQISVAFHAIVADTREEALYEELPYAIFKMQLFRGMMRNHLMTPEQAAAYPLTEIEKQLINDIRKTHIIGTAKEAGETLLNLQEQYGFDEAMIISMPHSQKARLKTYSLLAQELL